MHKHIHEIVAAYHRLNDEAVAEELAWEERGSDPTESDGSREQERAYGLLLALEIMEVIPVLPPWMPIGFGGTTESEAAYNAIAEKRCAILEALR